MCHQFDDRSKDFIFSYVRSASDVRDVIKRAKLHESDLTPLTQVLRNGDEDLNVENLKFLQLDQNILNELVVGGTVVFKGARNENAVLCTSNCTYDVKDAETSNSLLLVTDLLWSKDTKLNNDDSINDSLNDSSKSTEFVPMDTSLNSSGDSDTVIKSPRKLANKDILKVFYTYLEVRPCKPKLKKLNELLQYTLYTGPEKEYAVDKKILFSIDTLQEIIQASDKELLDGLHELQAFEIDGFYRILSFEYEFRVFSQMLDLIDENSWPLDRIQRSETITALNNIVPAVILDNIFMFYTTETDLIDGEQYYRYDDVKVCRVFARYILKDMGKFILEYFLQAWKESLPDGIIAELDMLRGMVLCDHKSNPPVIWAFNESQLSEDINERFRILFQTKEKWKIDEISPFIERYTTDKLNVNALLTKYARGSTQDNVRYYSAKHGK